MQFIGPRDVRRMLLCALVVACVTSGCGTLASLSQEDLAAMFMPPKVDQAELAVQRSRFMEEKSPESVDWILANALRQGMTTTEVGSAFGEDGERIYDDEWLKCGNLYQRTDETYRWGPDSAGRSVYLVFRDGTLVNYDPDQYARAPTFKK